VGKAALAGWRELLIPALGRLAIWPFDGPLFPLLASGRTVVAETYPGEVYHHLGLKLRAAGGKRSQAARAGAAPAILGWLAAQDVAISPPLAARVCDGFGPAGEDPFDALVGLVGMLEVLASGREPEAGPDPRVEGWILGQVLTRS
jgi:hypothetical protein